MTNHFQITIDGNSPRFNCGAAFSLAKPCKVDYIDVEIDANWRFSVNKNHPYVIVEGKITDGREVTFEEVYEKAQIGLDLLSVQNLAHLSLADAYDEYILWWTSNNKRIVRVVSLTDANISVSANVVITDADGNVIPEPPKPTPIYHPALRFFRLSQVTEELFDAYRNMWLAFESLLSWKYPKLKKANDRELENDRVWLERAIRTADDEFNLPKLSNSQHGDTTNEIIQRLYEDTRLRLFHAKHGKQYFLPYTTKDRVLVAEAYKNLSRQVIYLFDKLLNFNRPSGGMTNIGFRKRTKEVLADAVIITSSVFGDFDPNETLESDAWKNHLNLTTSYSDIHSKPGLEFIWGKFDLQTKGLSRLVVSRVSAKDQNHLLFGTSLQAELVMENIDIFEGLLGLRLVNVLEARTKYNT